MDEQQALLVIQSALDLIRTYYETLLFDKIQRKVEYQQEIGFSDILKARGKVSRRIEQIEYELEQDEGE
jgi:hypothetical protein